MTLKQSKKELYLACVTLATLDLMDYAIDIHMLARQMGTSVGMLKKYYSKLTATMAAKKLA
jgi:hypothetical protein